MKYLAMKILAADIGGTNSRFAAVEMTSPSNIMMSELFIFPTALKSIRSLGDLLGHFRENAPLELADLDQYQAITLGVAGAVNQGKATLPNIGWDIDLASFKHSKPIFLLNDFYAQAHAFLDKDMLNSLHTVRQGSCPGSGSIAVVGAGTGLGHAALIPFAGGRLVFGSESGHGTFAFHGQQERDIESFFLARKGHTWISSDDVVCGSGAALIHECLTGRKVSPAEALADPDGHSLSCKLFSRFYARACRNYCLAILPVERLVITGGIAAKNQHLLECQEFSDEFNDASHYRHLFEKIPIYLNTDQGLGIKGAAIHAWLQL